MTERQGDALDRALRDAVLAAEQAAEEARAWDPARRRRALEGLDRTLAALTAARSAVLLAERDAGSWRGSGDPSFAAWRGRTSRAGRGAAITEERRATTLADMPALREATVAGEVSVVHVDVVGKVVARGSTAVRTALSSAEGREQVLTMARQLDAGRFARAMDTWAATVDAAQLERTHQAQRAGRFLHVVDAPDGTRISGRLDAMAGHRLRLALEALTPRPAADDDRSPEQRRADALDALAETVLALPETKPGASVRPHVSFLMSEETWAALRAAYRDASAAGGAGAAGAGVGAGHGGAATVPPVTLEDGTPVPMSEVARALCDCELTRLVMDAADEPLNLGRAVRPYTGSQRRAVIARDRGCAWPGCPVPARWCEVHHIRWWERDLGETSVENGALLCSFHHHEVHRQDLTLVRRAATSAERTATGRGVAYVVARRAGGVVAGSPDGGPPGEAPRWGASGPPGGADERVGEPPGGAADEKVSEVRGAPAARPPGEPGRDEELLFVA